MKYVLIGLALLSMSCIKEEAAEDPRQREIVGFWFPCEANAATPGNEACNYVDDDGMQYTTSDSVSRIEGAYMYAKVKMGDTTPGTAFDIRTPELVFYAEPEERSGKYTILEDSLIIDAKIPGSDSSTRLAYRISLTDTLLSLFSGDTVTKRYRKYTGKAKLVTRTQWEEAMQ